MGKEAGSEMGLRSDDKIELSFAEELPVVAADITSSHEMQG